MKTGIVFAIDNNKAVIMLTGGSFIEVIAKAGWKKGDVVSVKKQHFSIKPLYAVAACFVLVFFFAASANRLYFTEVSTLSIDINPSIEMGLNRFDRIITVTGFNDDGLQVLGSVNLLHKTYLTAVEELITSEALEPYLAEEEVYIAMTVYSDIPEKSDMLSVALKSEVESISAQYIGVNAACEVVTYEFINEAHEHNLTPGKYSEILELQELAPEIDIDDYKDISIKEIKSIKNQIKNKTHSDDHDKINPDEDNDVFSQRDVGFVESGPSLEAKSPAKNREGPDEKEESEKIKNEGSDEKEESEEIKNEESDEKEKSAEIKNEGPDKKGEDSAKNNERTLIKENGPAKKNENPYKKEEGPAKINDDPGKKGEKNNGPAKRFEHPAKKYIGHSKNNGAYGNDDYWH